MQNLFSCPVVVEELTAEPRKYKLCATAEERAYITEVLKVVDTKTFEATLMVQLFRKEHRIEVSGRVKASLELTSVVSLENFVKTYTPTFSINFDTQLTPEEFQIMELDLEADVPDMIIDGKIDLAELAMEQIALAIDDFPRKDGEVFNFKCEFDEETTEAMNPFAVLAKLKN